MRVWLIYKSSSVHCLQSAYPFHRTNSHEPHFFAVWAKREVYDPAYITRILVSFPILGPRIPIPAKQMIGTLCTNWWFLCSDGSITCWIWLPALFYIFFLTIPTDHHHRLRFLRLLIWNKSRARSNRIRVPCLVCARVVREPNLFLLAGSLMCAHTMRMYPFLIFVSNLLLLLYSVQLESTVFDVCYPLYSLLCRSHRVFVPNSQKYIVPFTYFISAAVSHLSRINRKCKWFIRIIIASTIFSSLFCPRSGRDLYI